MKNIELINNSHKECDYMKIGRGRLYSKKIISSKDLQDKLKDNRELIIVANKFINEIYGFLKGSNFFSIFADKEGCILNVIGDESILKEAFELKMFPGAYMNVENIGTNGIGMALSQGAPLQISGKDHYIKAYYKWTCSAAPIRNDHGAIIGVINLTGYIENVHPHTLGMVVTAARAIENMLKMKAMDRDFILMEDNNLEKIFDSINYAVAVSDNFGNIKFANKSFSEFTDYSIKRLMNMNIQDMMDNWYYIKDKIYREYSVENIETSIKCSGKMRNVSLKAYLIHKSKITGKNIVWIFNKLEKSRKLSGRLSEGKAIYTFDKVIGKNGHLLDIIEYAKKISDSRSTILISGESGTGKEVFAQSIHNYSNRSEEPFIAVNCGAIPVNLIESELFGYDDGAFTGAKKGGNPGKFEMSDRGTIFLDEIGEMSPKMQVRLLRVIEEGVITRIGSSKQIPINVRIIAATNRDLRAEVQKEKFRKDLFYRLNVLPIYLPPLKDRKEDIPLLIDYYMDKISKKLNKEKINIGNMDMNKLMAYNWPGNIRELQNLIELSINMGTLQYKNISANSICEKDSNYKNNDDKKDFEMNLEAVERRHIMKVVKLFKGNITMASKAMGIGRNTLYRKIKKYNIQCSL